jgi:hypothetical protein
MFSLLFFYIKMFLYTLMKLVITLVENVNKSRISAGRLSLTPTSAWRTTAATLGAASPPWLSSGRH